MSDDSDFFGDVFEDPEDDPLLGGEDASAENRASDTPEDQGPPSWMTDDPQSNGRHKDGDDERAKETGPEQKQIVVDQRGEKGEGIDALNQAVGQGWRLVRICLARPDGEQSATPRAANRFVAILEQDHPQSLFDFGAAA